MLHLFYLISQSYSLQVYAHFSTENTVWKCISMISYNILVVDFSEKNKIPTSLFISFRSTNHVCNRISENSLPVMYGWQIPQPWLNLPVISCTQAVGRWPGSTALLPLNARLEAYQTEYSAVPETGVSHLLLPADSCAPATTETLSTSYVELLPLLQTLKPSRVPVFSLFFFLQQWETFYSFCPLLISLSWSGPHSSCLLRAITSHFFLAPCRPIGFHYHLNIFRSAPVPKKKEPPSPTHFLLP